MLLKGNTQGNVLRVPVSSVNKVVKGHPTYGIIGGEFVIAADDSKVAVSTLLGSCVAIMLYDKVRKIRGMNHFLLPECANKTESYKYGLFSIESMINEMLKLGCSKTSMVAKIAGGANMLQARINNIGQRNVVFAKEFCDSEGLNVTSEHVLGEQGRVVLLTAGFETFIRKVSNRLMDEKIKEDDMLLKTKIDRQNCALDSDITLF